MPRISALGVPQVGMCAPGVAVVSSVPGGGYAAWDGTSMAASHVVGFSALLLSHHPMLQSINYGARADQRVSTLYDILRAAAVPYAQVDPTPGGRRPARSSAGAGLAAEGSTTLLWRTDWNWHRCRPRHTARVVCPAGCLSGRPHDHEHAAAIARGGAVAINEGRAFQPELKRSPINVLSFATAWPRRRT